MPDLSTIRTEIDATDRKILTLLARRQQLVSDVAASKKVTGKVVRDKGREKELLAERKKLALELGLPPAEITKIFERILSLSRDSQVRLLKLSEKLKPKKLTYREKTLKTNLGLTEIFARLRAKYDTAFLLESLGEDADFSRRSFIGFDPYAIITGEPGQLIVDLPTGRQAREVFATPNPYEALKHFLPRLPKGRGFRGGLFGYLTYEATRFFEPAVAFKHHPDFPDFEFGLYYDGLIFDKETGKLTYFYLHQDRSKTIEKVLQSKLTKEPTFKAQFTGTNLSQQEFEAGVTEGLKEIIAGNTFQFQFGRKYLYELTGDRMHFYETLRRINPSPHMFYLSFEGGTRELIGSSPELIVRVEDGFVENYPLAGTRKRTGDAKIDEQIANELLANEKERAEHMMLIDLGRNDVGRVCEFGSVKVPKCMIIKRFSHVQHIASEIVGKLRADQTAFDALATNTPVGTVSGAPKIETMKIIERLERDARGPYAGAVGFFSLTGDCVFAANLRSLYAAGKQATVQASAGIVADSVPAHEFGEVEKKTAAIRVALEEASKN